jgi:adenylate cyclase
MFTDIAGFTDLAELMAVEELETFMNFYLSEMSKIIFELNGTLDKYIGDAIMSFWNAPLDQPEHAAAACQAALQIRDREVALREKLGEIGVFGIQTRIGINTGPMVVGNLGSSQKVNYTVLGDSVILASRLEGANKIYGSQILVAQPTVDVVKDRFTFRKLDLLRVKGRRRPMPVYELLAAGQVDGAVCQLVEQFESALHAYEKRDWDDAERILVALQARFPDDGPTRVLLGRVRAFRDQPPPADWDGVYVAREK